MHSYRMHHDDPICMALRRESSDLIQRCECVLDTIVDVVQNTGNWIEFPDTEMRCNHPSVEDVT